MYVHTGSLYVSNWPAAIYIDQVKYWHFVRKWKYKPKFEQQKCVTICCLCLFDWIYCNEFSTLPPSGVIKYKCDLQAPG